MIRIRQATTADTAIIRDVTRRAFATAEHSDGTEADLFTALQTSQVYIPELSLVAESDGTIIGHIHLTQANPPAHTPLALAPRSVLPRHQKQGIGQTLIRESHQLAAAMGYPYSIVLGSETYYPRAGYLPVEHFGISAPAGIPSRNLMACPLTGTAPILRGAIRYAPEFGLESSPGSTPSSPRPETT